MPREIQFVRSSVRPTAIRILLPIGYRLLSDQERTRRARQETDQKHQGGDLVNTPTEFYLEIIDNLPRIDSYCSSLFSADVLGGRFPLRLLPYPAGVLLFLSLRWAQDLAASEDDQYTSEDLTRIFRAFFWSNVFAGRYDQGFLSLFASDQKELKRILLQYKAHGDRQQWAELIDTDLDKGMFSGTYSRAEKKEIEQDLLNGELRGAKRQAIIIFLLSGTKTDLATGAKLDYLSEDKDRKVQLHHIYPKQWCKNNKGTIKILANPDSVNCAANLVPLSPASNNAWMTRSPATAVQHFELEYDETDPRFGNAFINREMFECLAKDTDPEEFWNMRASLLADRLHGLQYVAQR